MAILWMTISIILRLTLAEVDHQSQGNTNPTVHIRTIAQYQHVTDHNEVKPDVLTEISTTFIHDQIDDKSASYNISFTDVVSGKVCHNVSIASTSSACVQGICSYVFHTSSSLCPNSSDLNAVVSLIDSNPYKASRTIRIGAVNRLMTIEVNEKTSTVSLKFINQPEESEKHYSIRYGPVNTGCENLPYEIRGHLHNSSSIIVQLINNVTKDAAICLSTIATNGTETITVKGVYGNGLKTKSHQASIIAGVTVLVWALVLCLSASFIYLCFYSRVPAIESVTETGGIAHKAASKLSATDSVTKTGGIEQTTADKLSSQEKSSLIDLTTTWFRLLHVTRECSSYEFCKEKLPEVHLQKGFGYLKFDAKRHHHIQYNRRIIVMDEVNEDIPKYVALINSSAFTQEIKAALYIQEGRLGIKLSPGDRFLYCVLSKVINTKTYWRAFDVTQETKEITFLTERMPGYTVDWIRYGYFEFTKPEYINPTQRVIVLKKDGKLVKGKGIRYLLGATGDGSEVTHPPNMTNHPEWKRVFIQNKGGNRILTPNTQFLFCADMFKISGSIHRHIKDVAVSCKLGDFGRQTIIGYKPERGYGYYEFAQDECLKTHTNVIMVDQYDRLFTGPGARFFYTGCEYGKEELEGTKKISPPDLSDTTWKHIFVQGHDEDRLLQPRTKFLYCEYKKPLV